jgi:T5orf172 domain
MKFVYIMKDPFGRPDLKIGKTGNPKIRLGVYQNSYSSKSHYAAFNKMWYGDNSVIDKLEASIKQQHDWDIELDGRGHSEWLYNVSVEDIEKSIDQIITDYKYKVKKIDESLMPINVSTWDNVIDTLKSNAIKS